MSQQVLIPGLDPTAYQAIEGAQLLQMVSQCTFATGVGGILVTTDTNTGAPIVPNANIDATLVNYVWLRVGNVGTSGNFASAYVWNPNNPNPTNPGVFLNWNPISTLAAGSINGAALIANSVPASALQGGITPSQVNGLSNLMATVLLATSNPGAGAISGSFLSGFSLTGGSVTPASFQAGAINSNSFIAGQIIEPFNLATDTATAYSVPMASGVNAVPSWISKAILALADPGAGTDTGYIPVYQANGTYALVSPGSALGGSAISSITAISVTAMTITVITGTSHTFTITVSSALPSSTPGFTFPVTFSGTGSTGATLNGSWTGTIVSSTQFTVVVTGTAVAVTSGNFPTHACYFTLLGAQTNITSLSGLSSTTPGQVQVNFTGNYGNTNYLAFASITDSSTTDCINAKIVNKAVGSITIGFWSQSANAMAALPAGTVHLICV